MKALRFNEYGQPDVLRIEEMDLPKPGAGEVLVKVAAAAINPSDVKNVAGLFGASLPRTPGRDFSGTVVSPGSWQGREVWGSGAGFGVVRDGAQREYIGMPEAWLSAKPVNLTLAQAATVGVPFITAWTALMRAGALQPGETLLVTGSSGAVGHAAIQIAKWQGARVIGVGNPAQTSQADLLLDARSADWLTAAREATEGRGADIVFDIVGGPLFETALQALRPGGRQIAIASAGQRRVEFDLLDFYHQQLHLVGVDTMKLTGPEIAAILDALRPGFEAGVLTPATHHSWAPERAAEAYGVVAAGHVAQKQVLVFG